MREENQDIIFSDSIEEIITKVPPWILRWGNLLIGLVIVLIMVASAFFPYPEKVKGPILITTDVPPVYLQSMTSGRLIDFRVQENQMVQAGELLAVIENPADLIDVLSAKSWLDSLEYRCELDSVTAFNADTTLILGSIQEPYAILLKAMISYQRFHIMNEKRAIKKSLEKQLSGFTNLYKQQVKQNYLIEEKVKNQDNSFQRTLVLTDSGALSNSQLEEASLELLTAKQELQSERASLAQTVIQIDHLKHKILELEQEDELMKTALEADLLKQIQTVRGVISQWEKDFLIISPVNGQVSLANIGTENQYVQAGDRLLTIIPENYQVTFGKMTVPLRGAGKVKEKQQVMIRLNDYPYLEYGMLKGEVTNMGKVSDEGFYIAEIHLNKGLETSSGFLLPIISDVMGEAEIITGDVSLLVRMIRPLRHLTDKYQD